MTNRLSKESSLYLRQHANNLVDWYPWSEEALEKARREDKPILVSIGYAACHWCHVMAHESFENPATARLMNDYFVNIKVDREERPDIDSVFMEAVQTISGSGGWPLTVFLTSDGKPFFGGTYFPPEDRQGMPGFTRVLKAVYDAYTNRKGEIEQSSAQIIGVLKRSPSGDTNASLSVETLDEAYTNIKSSFDWINGGFGDAPKFPQAMVLEFLLRYHRRTREPEALQMVTLTLEKMATGGIYDQIGGGFHRYSTDAKWLVPHFEKMLYDNALLSLVYLHAFQITKRPEFRRIAQETFDYILRDLTDEAGGFFSTRDADSEGEEGKFYVWQSREFNEVLGDKLSRHVSDFYSVSAVGNFYGSNILQSSRMLTGELPEAVIKARKILLEHREKRIKPARDEKIIAAWNGLMLSSMTEAAFVLDRDDYLQAAIKNGEFLSKALMSGTYTRHVWNEGQSKIDGFLSDYSSVIDAFIKLHEATFEGKWLRKAIDMANVMVELFWDDDTGTFFDVGREHETLVVRPRTYTDNSIPSGPSAAVLNLFRLSRITGREEFETTAAKSLRSVIDLCGNHPLNFSNWLCALDFYLSPSQEIAIIGNRNSQDTRDIMKVIHDKWLPNKVLVATEPGNAVLSELPILENKSLINNRASVYICEHFTCRSPLTSPKQLKQQLDELDL